MEDRDIILLLKTQPSDGLLELMKKYHLYAEAVIRRILPGKAQDIEECVEDTFVNLWRSAGRIDPDCGTLKGLVLSTARNLAITRYHKLRRTPAEPLEDTGLPTGDDTADLVLDAQSSETIKHIILALGEPDRSIFFRKYFLFESYREIAQETGLDEGQIKNRLHRGRHRLRKQLEERGLSYEAI